MSARYSKPIYLHDIPWWVYDLLIAAGCLCFTFATVFWTPLAILPLAILSYGSFIEPRLLIVRRYSIDVGDRAKAAGAAHATGQTFKFAFLSDIHVGPYKGRAWVRKLVRRTQALSPDLILLGGDFLYEQAGDLPKLEPLKELRAPIGVFAILGNHDEYKSSREAHAWFASSGIPMLLNRSVRLAHGGAEFALAGADDDWYGQTDLEAAFRGVPSDIPLIAMLHNPDLSPPAAELLKGRSAPTVFLSGHTHGGQIRLPFIGSVPPLPHHLGRRYDRGVFEVPGTSVPGTKGTGMPLVIGAGTGESGPRVRLFCPPEIVLLTMRF